MGTRHLIAVVQNQTYKVAQYGQWDGYPEGQGRGILTFLKEKYDKDKFAAEVNKLRWVTDAEIEDINKNHSGDWRRVFPYLSRDCSADVLEFIQSGNVKFLSNKLAFVNDSLFCEWAYVIDLDKGTFEVYKGFTKSKLTEGERFYTETPNEDGYWPCRHVVTFKLDSLPNEKDFLKVFKTDDED